ncbi:hypothetical protein BV898_06443 [Hypsibius exemplaris]|uniref:Uncharacterized protein n=1 Tax=Hypsibius exemplaris TaxID=2072580 RepID=A0A1W0WW77_HYPEX|nr:hypothetical protein BV898_06443 [Hypsibius exemplaris]
MALQTALHVSLAASPLLTGITGLFNPLAKLIDPSFSTNWPYYLAHGGVTTFYIISEYSYGMISLDRWLAIIVTGNAALISLLILARSGSICVAAFRIKWRLIRGRHRRIRQTCCSSVEDRRQWRLDWERWMVMRSVMGALSVVGMVLVFGLPGAAVFVNPAFTDTQPLLVSAVYLLLFARDIPMFAIYFAFYPHYLVILKRLMRWST